MSGFTASPLISSFYSTMKNTTVDRKLWVEDWKQTAVIQCNLVISRLSHALHVVYIIIASFPVSILQLVLIPFCTTMRKIYSAKSFGMEHWE